MGSPSTRMEHFFRGNNLSLADVAEWSTIPRQRLEGLIAGVVEMHLHDMRRILTTCSHLLGRRVKLSELFDFDESQW